ncbi:MAG: Type 1 glutamine amidotransferase-like domain-containing protein [Patescibacteria group bacterium]|jgi:dipeptidase E
MKLLLTSAGLTNPSISHAAEELLGQPAEGVKLAFIPTAANVEPGDKSWMIQDLNNFQNAGFEVDIVDISAVSKDTWLPRLLESKILFLGGGNTFHLMHWVQKSGLQEELPSLLKTRVYAGISAGSCITGPTVYNSVQNLFGEKYDLQIKAGLGLVGFQFIPHLNSAYFDKIREVNLREASKNLKEPVYALDDNSALKITDDKVEIISEGEYLLFNA